MVSNNQSKSSYNDRLRTPRTKLKRWQQAAKGEVALSTDEKKRESDACCVTFEEMYRPYIYNFLRRRGFSGDADGLTHEATGIEAKDVYAIIFKKFWSTILLSFNFDGEKVGEGGFRRYLKTTIDRLLIDLFELVPARDKNGCVIYTDEVRKHRDGTPVVDKNGNPVFKKKLVPKCTLNKSYYPVEKVDERDAFIPVDVLEDWKSPTKKDEKEHGGGGIAAVMTSHAIAKCLLRLAKVAYLLTIESRRKRTRSMWRLEAMEAIFRHFKDEEVVRNELIAKGLIKGRTSFDNLKSLFLADWKSTWYRLYSRKLQGPKVERKGDKIVFLKNKYTWQTLDSANNIFRYVYEQESLVDPKALKDVSENYERKMISLLFDADQSKK